MSKPIKVKLTTAQSNLLKYTERHSQAIFSGVLSTIAIDGHKYAVDEYTKFELDKDMENMTITQVEPEEDKAKGKGAVKASS